MSRIAGSRWTEKASADNALATATHAAATGVRHYVTAVTAGFSAAATKTLQIKDGATVIYEIDVVNQQHFVFPSPLEMSENSAAVAELAASGGAGNVGKVSMAGFTA